MEASGGAGGDAQPDGAPDAAVESATDSPAEAGIRGNCASEAECSGRPCLQLPASAEGWHTCDQQPPEMSACDHPSVDECCNSSECKTGTGGCFSNLLFFCGGAEPPPQNVCLYSECDTSDQCTAKSNGVCVNAGAFGEPVDRCVYGGCVLDAGCIARPGGACMPFFDPCNHRFAGFFCTYDDSACRSDADCSAQGKYCDPGDDGHTSCETWQAYP